MKLSQDLKKYLSAWDCSVPDNYSSSRIELESRRQFLKKLLATATITAMPVFASTKSDPETLARWKTLSAVQLHMFPVSKGEPDAHSINAAGYLKSILEWPGVDDEDKKFIIDGVGWLNGLSEKTFAKRFEQLNDMDKEQILRTVEKSQAGENWLSLILLYLIEALLTDPVYGGNVNGEGWQWLEHQSGFPAPSADKRYFNL